MTIHRYGCKLRAPVLGGLPEVGMRGHSNKRGYVCGVPCWGWVEYDRELTRTEIEENGLILIMKIEEVG